jgi:hypothetical protein
MAITNIGMLWLRIDLFVLADYLFLFTQLVCLVSSGPTPLQSLRMLPRFGVHRLVSNFKLNFLLFLAMVQDASQRIVFVRPTTFMNLSGRSIAAAYKRHHLQSPQHVCSPWI